MRLQRGQCVPRAAPGPDAPAPPHSTDQLLVPTATGHRAPAVRRCVSNSAARTSFAAVSPCSEGPYWPHPGTAFPRPLRRVFSAANLPRSVSGPAALATSSKSSRKVRTSTSSKGCGHGISILILVTAPSERKEAIAAGINEDFRRSEDGMAIHYSKDGYLFTSKYHRDTTDNLKWCEGKRTVMASSVKRECLYKNGFDLSGSGSTQQCASHETPESLDPATSRLADRPRAAGERCDQLALRQDIAPLILQSRDPHHAVTRVDWILE
ncbi:hypothetical protein T265_06911 [Opisthorchis viverrini]|uniref:Uncharacterized protein n=1 Tax=Opisthorchis viverrini TaxID=6198 RepID=A0A074ZQS3_OPIVI|nr:hypothetical protein T265_06911 [Opisthorchis viverrini]KER25675.1 hypothetical protein T265_06911 [Opisthorchis viverrini]